MATWYSNGAVNGNSNHDWDATNAWNSATGGGGTAGNPGAGDHAIVQSGDVVTLTEDDGVGSTRIIGELVGTATKVLTLDGSSDDNLFRRDGTISGDLNIKVAYHSSITADKRIKYNSGTGNINDIEMDSTGKTVLCGDGSSATTLSIDGGLTITAGTFSTDPTQNGALTVTGLLDVDGGNLTIYDSAVSCAKLIVESGDTITAAHSSNALTVTGAGIGNNRSIDFTGAISGTLNIITTHTGTREDDLSASSGSINHLTVNHASAVMKMNASATIGNLTITAGTFSTADAGGNSKALTVTGQTIVGDGSSAAGTAKFYSNASTLSLGATYTSSYAVWVKQGGTFEGSSGAAPTGEHTFGSYVNADHNDSITRLTTHANGTIVTAENASSGTYGFAWTQYEDATFHHSNGLVTFTGATLTSNSTSFYGLHDHALHNVTINASGKTYYLKTNAVIDANLTITAGTLNTAGDSGSKSLTAGKTNVASNGTLTLNSSTVSLKSLGTNAGTINGTTGDITITDEESGWALYWQGAYTFNHNNGRVVIDFNTGGKGDGTNIQVYNGANQRLNDLKIDLDTAGQLVEWHTDGHFGMDGDLTLEQGTFRRDPNELSETFTADGDVLIKSNSTFGGTDDTGTNNFGSLTIDSGGTYIATSRTTTINGGFHNNGTYTPNRGTIEMTGTGSVVNALVPKLKINNDYVGSYVGSDRVTISDSTPTRYSGNGNNTWSCWINASGLGGNNNGRIFDKAHAYMYVTSDGSTGYYLSSFIEHEGTDMTAVTNQSLNFNVWYHVALVYEGTGNTAEIFVNGVQQTLGTDTAGVDAVTSDTGDHTIIGNNSGATRGFYGMLADYQYWSTNLPAADIQILASKINSSIEPMSTATSSCKVRATLLNGSTTDESPNSGTITYTNAPTDTYNAFTTTLLPTMTEVDSLEVKSGVLDLDNRSYVHLDGTNDYINTNGAFQSLFRTSHTISAWVKLDDGTPSNNDTILGTFNDGNDRILFYIGTGGLLTYLYQANGTGEYAEEASASFTDGATKWTHCVATVQYNTSSSATMKLYVNGVERTLDVAGGDDGTFTGDMGSYTSSTTAYIGAEHQESSADEFFKDGAIKDVQLYDYTLSAEQVKSLYLGRYLPTPKHWWKINEGTGATATIEDYGTGTDSDGTGVSLTWAGTDNFKVNGSARIGTNGSV